MAVFETYQAIGQAEDVEDEIYMISPVDNPLVSMSRTIRAKATKHEWQEDELAAAAYNAVAEKAAAPAASHTPTVMLSNYTQIMSKVAEISGTLEEVDKYGRDSEMARELMKKYAELANDEEKAIVGATDDGGGAARQSPVAGSSGTAREMGSFHYFMTTTDFAIDTRATYEDADGEDRETTLLTAHQKAYAKGANPGYLLTSPANSLNIAGLANASGRARDIRNERTIVNVIDLYVSPFGELDVVLDRHQDDCWLGVDFNYVATAVLRPTDDWPLAKTGDFERRQVLRESTLAVLNRAAHFMVDNVSTGTTGAP